MKNKSFDSTGALDFEVKDQNIKHVLSKFDYELFDEEMDLTEKVIRVKKVNMPNKGSKWKIMSDNKVIFIVESTKISKKEKEFLQTIEGFNFMLAQAKKGIKSLNNFRVELKKTIKESAKNTK